MTREQHAALVVKIKRDIKNIACIYPTAFDLHEEPMDRLARRIANTVAKELEQNAGTTT